MDEYNRPPQIAFFLSRRVVYAHVDTIKQSVFHQDLLIRDRHNTLKTDHSKVDHTNTVTQTNRVSNISLEDNKQG